jgi:hypothetical protein
MKRDDSKDLSIVFRALVNLKCRYSLHPTKHPKAKQLAKAWAGPQLGFINVSYEHDFIQRQIHTSFEDGNGHSNGYPVRIITAALESGYMTRTEADKWWTNYYKHRNETNTTHKEI